MQSTKRKLRDLLKLSFNPLCKCLPAKPEAEFQQLVSAIERDGQTTPILVANGEIIDGRHRLLAFQKIDRYLQGELIDVTDFGVYPIEKIDATIRSMALSLRQLKPRDKAIWGAERRFFLEQSNSKLPTTIAEDANELGISKRLLEHYLQQVRSGSLPGKEVAKNTSPNVKLNRSIKLIRESNCERSKSSLESMIVQIEQIAKQLKEGSPVHARNN